MAAQGWDLRRLRWLKTFLPATEPPGLDRPAMDRRTGQSETTEPTKEHLVSITHRWGGSRGTQRGEFNLFHSILISSSAAGTDSAAAKWLTAIIPRGLAFGIAADGGGHVSCQ